MAGTAQANRTRRDASGGPSGCHPRLRKQSVCRHPGRGTVARVEVKPVNMRDAEQIERGVTAFARSPGGGLIVAAGPAATRHRD